MQEAVRLALHRRFGPLDGALNAAIDAADIAALSAILAQIATITLDEVRQALPQPE